MINYDKTKYTELCTSPIRKNYIIINNHNIKNVAEFKYLTSYKSRNQSQTQNMPITGEHKLLWAKKSIAVNSIKQN
jgi:hypothetical protein